MRGWRRGGGGGGVVVGWSVRGASSSDIVLRRGRVRKSTRFTCVIIRFLLLPVPNSPYGPCRRKATASSSLEMPY